MSNMFWRLFLSYFGVMHDYNWIWFPFPVLSFHSDKKYFGLTQLNQPVWPNDRHHILSQFGTDCENGYLVKKISAGERWQEGKPDNYNTLYFKKGIPWSEVYWQNHVEFDKSFIGNETSYWIKDFIRINN